MSYSYATLLVVHSVFQITLGKDITLIYIIVL